MDHLTNPPPFKYQKENQTITDAVPVNLVNMKDCDWLIDCNAHEFNIDLDEAIGQKILTILII